MCELCLRARNVNAGLGRSKVRPRLSLSLLVWSRIPLSILKRSASLADAEEPAFWPPSRLVSAAMSGVMERAATKPRQTTTCPHFEIVPMKG